MVRGSIITSLLLVSSFITLSEGAPQGFNPAAAPPVDSDDDCACQCISLSFVDIFGITQGGCKSTYRGAQWCYVQYGGFSPCPDLVPSKRYNGRYISNHACATPAANSFECNNAAPFQVPFSAPASSVATPGVADGDI